MSEKGANVQRKTLKELQRAWRTTAREQFCLNYLMHCISIKKQIKNRVKYPITNMKPSTQ